MLLQCTAAKTKKFYSLKPTAKYKISGKIMIIGHGLNPCIVASSSYTFEVESPPKVSYQTQRSLVREVQVPVRSVSR